MQPNIIFMTCHDLGQHLGCYGQETVHSPALDHLAQEGVLFANSFCTAPQCTPSRAALHTGKHAHSVGVMGLAHPPFNWHLQPEQMHNARRLREAGYETTLIGGQHVTHEASLNTIGYDRVYPQEPAGQLAARTKRFLADNAGKTQPFYLEIGFFETHRPYNWGGATPDRTKGVHVPPYLPDTPEAITDFAALQGMIRTLDEAVGHILAAVEETGLTEDTLIIFVADHGLAMPRAKCTLYDPGIRTALIMRWPGQNVSGGRRYPEMISHVDVLPTVLESIGLPIPDSLHGRSFWPLLQGNAYEPNQMVFAEKTYHTAYEPMRGIRTPTHKLILNFEVGLRYDVPGDVCQSPIYPLLLEHLAQEREPVELYDLQYDPGETVNLAGRPELAGIETDLIGHLRGWMERTHDPLLYGPIASPFFEHTRRLLDIGW